MTRDTWPRDNGAPCDTPVLPGPVFADLTTLTRCGCLLVRAAAAREPIIIKETLIYEHADPSLPASDILSCHYTQTQPSISIRNQLLFYFAPNVGQINNAILQLTFSTKNR